MNLLSNIVRLIALTATIGVLYGCAYGHTEPEVPGKTRIKQIDDNQGFVIFSPEQNRKGNKSQVSQAPTVDDPEYQEYLEWKRWQEFQAYKEWKEKQGPGEANSSTQ